MSKLVVMSYRLIAAGRRGSRRVPANYSLAACDSQKLARWAVAVATVCASIGCHQSREDAHAREVATRVRTEFLHAWTNYEKYAWGHDALKPLSKTPHDWSIWLKIWATGSYPFSIRRPDFLTFMSI